MPVKILKERRLTLAEVKKILEERSMKGELSYIQRVTLDYATKFSQLSVEKSIEIVKRLIENFGVSESTAIQIVNAVPKSIDELRVFLTNEQKIFTEEELNKILKILEET
ncbi:MAG: DNA-directed RNA polymerase subunit F [Candidatus Freyarchaeota archaeon]|nr:DNA-directed RNA polymerase subunit F [Candidatus Jordarchaeia archaeon]MBS7269340.1 DNA-directed RNA polymerase subunit F [Candidatus Jordarchaeia archaeon]MBS7278637.1 DNA-directed RNA polymerase subunit F [Candidatus Jordarchaeia archaeon]